MMSPLAFVVRKGGGGWPKRTYCDSPATSRAFSLVPQT